LHGARKWLIFNDLSFCRSVRHRSQALDFSALAADFTRPINKVIHRFGGCLSKGFGFKDLSATSVKKLRISR
jgi:hypothetical protein